ncbi:MAG: DUF4435 domain-containing protein [Butyrivibrio hungatei]|nr:DUF4435 domain-containing protein [Butyrivibrio hungatei]
MDLNEEMVFSDDAELSRYYFFQDNNDITFFFEDKDKEYEYEEILNRLFNKKYKIAAIIAMGGKSKVKEAFEEFGEYDNLYPDKKNFYIVDGDFDRIIHQEDMIINDHFLYLDCYNIENYFVDENAVLLFMSGKLKMKREQVSLIVKFNSWLQKITDQGKDLFFLYCAIQNSMYGVQNVARSEYKFLNYNTGFARSNAYEEYYKEIYAQNMNIDNEIKEIKMKYSSIYGDNYYQLICGKFFLSSLYSYLSSLGGSKFTKEEFRWFLICNFDIGKLQYVKERVNSIMQ